MNIGKKYKRSQMESFELVKDFLSSFNETATLMLDNPFLINVPVLQNDDDQEEQVSSTSSVPPTSGRTPLQNTTSSPGLLNFFRG
jgi:hypothetical protein